MKTGDALEFYKEQRHTIEDRTGGPGWDDTFEMDADDFIKEIKRFTEECNPSNMVKVCTYDNGFVFVEYHLETESEFDIRMNFLEVGRAKLKVRQDRQWAKQKEKFASARK